MALKAEGKKILRKIQKRLKDDIRLHRKSFFNMNSWLTIPDEEYDKLTELLENESAYNAVAIPDGFCNTVGCIAGTVAIESGYRPVVSKGYFGEPFVDDYTLTKDGKEASVPQIASEVLGVSRRECNKLFSPWNDQEAHEVIDTPNNPYWNGLRTNRRKDVIKAIERFIRRNS